MTDVIDFEIPDGTLPIFMGDVGTVVFFMGEGGDTIFGMKPFTKARRFIVPMVSGPITPERLEKVKAALLKELPDADHIRVCRSPKGLGVFAAKGKYVHGHEEDVQK